VQAEFPVKVVRQEAAGKTGKELVGQMGEPGLR
jgi:hypothetical protein